MNEATPKKIAAWAGAVTMVGAAVAMVFGPVKTSVRSLVAQEAAAAATGALETRLAPLEKQFVRKIQLDRRRDDREEISICMAERVEAPEGPPRDRRCRAESDYRWALWGYQDCADVKGEEDPTCVKPDTLPRLGSQRR